ncbi:molybdopterin oxidoreductase family protein [Candidatus Margulisiibacteriota bacterium]
MVNKKRSICLFCSMGCGTAFRTAGEHVTAIDYDKDNPVNGGSLCPRGNYNFELLNHPQRLAAPQIGQRKVSWSEALSFLSHGLKEFEPDSIGIVLSCLASNEEACLAAKLAKLLGVKNIAAAGDPADLEAYQGARSQVEGAELAKIEELGDEEALLIIGDVLNRAPVLAKRINKVKYGKRGNKIIVIDPNKTHTSWFATTHLQNKPGTAALLLAAMLKAIGGRVDVDLDEAAKKVGIPAAVIEAAAKDFDSATSGTIVFVPDKSKPRNDLIAYFVKSLAGHSSGKKFINFYGFGNTLGVNTILDQAAEGHTSYPELMGKIANGQVKAMIMLGEDLAATHPELEKKIRHLKFVAMSNYLPSRLADDSVLLLPLASHLEGAATYTLADGRTEKLEPVAAKVGAMSNLEIMVAIMNSNLDLTKVAQEAAELAEKGVPLIKVERSELMAEALKLKAAKDAPEINIAHFGNNSLARNFMWYKVNNIG